MRKLFFGFLFIMIRIQIGGFDIFPDPIGYGLIYLGAGELLSRAPGFAGLQRIAMFGAVFSLAMLGFGVLSSFWAPAAVIVFVMGILGAAATLVLLYVIGTNLLDAFTQLGLNGEGVDAIDGLKKSWSSYFTAMAISTGVALFVLINPMPAALIIILLAGLMSLIFSIQFLVRLNRFTSREPLGVYHQEVEFYRPIEEPQEKTSASEWKEIPDDIDDELGR